MKPSGLSAAWRDRADGLRPYARGAAAAFRRAALELEGAVEAYADERVSIEAAAAESGYSPAGLRRLVRDGVLPNRSKKPGEILLRRGDLPRKPGHGVAPADEEAPAPAPEPAPAVARPIRRAQDAHRQVARAIAMGER